MKQKKTLAIALIGPTASGKTSLGIEIAQKLKIDIHNIDSRQIYLDMDIGTAKPTIEEQKQAKHLLIDLCQPNQRMSLYEFKQHAENTIDKNLADKKFFFLVGGSGLYLQALIGGLLPPAVPAQKTLRAQLDQLTKHETYKLLKSCDPQASENIHPQDSIRIIRALEVFYATGQTISSQQDSQPPPWNVLEIGLNPKNLVERIANRTKAIYKKGLIEETENLIKKYGNHLSLLKTIGYGEATSIIKGKLDLEEAIKITTHRTCQFAKRQKTWFRNKHNPNWLNDEEPLEEALSLIEEALAQINAN